MKEYGATTCASVPVDPELPVHEDELAVTTYLGEVPDPDPRMGRWNEHRITLWIKGERVMMTVEESQDLRANLEEAELDVARVCMHLMLLPAGVETVKGEKISCAFCQRPIKPGQIRAGTPAEAIHMHPSCEDA